MSGGSYDFLCHKDESDIFSCSAATALHDMANRLDALCPEAAAETRALFDGPGSLRHELSWRIGRLTDIWKAVEWVDSSDWGKDQLDHAVEQFRQRPAAPVTMTTELERTREIARLTAQAAMLLAQAERLASRAGTAQEKP